MGNLLSCTIASEAIIGRLPWASQLLTHHLSHKVENRLSDVQTCASSLQRSQAFTAFIWWSMRPRSRGNGLGRLLYGDH